MGNRILLCTDLDRTLLPNGPQPESFGARDRLRHLVARPELVLAFVSGRHRTLVKDAMAEWDLPSPAWVIGDVGTTLWQVEAGGKWLPDEAWERTIGADWCGHGATDLADCLSGAPGLELQPQTQQNRHKLSYFLPADADTEALAHLLLKRLELLGVRTRLVFSTDETKNQGLLDVLPERASKRHAIEALMVRLGLDQRATVFCGDSGNDLEVLASDIPSVLVAYATDSVRSKALELANTSGQAHCLYLAQGDFLGMNGNYAAGILEGIAHYHPQTISWMDGGTTT